MTLPRLLLIVLAGLALYVAADGRTSTPREVPVTSPALLGAPNGAQPSARDSAGSAGGDAVRLGIPVLSDTSGAPLPGLDQRQVEEAGVPSAGSADLTPLARPLSKTAARMGTGLRPTAGPAADPPLAVGPVCSSPCSVDVSEWDQPTPEPVSVNGIASHMGRGFPSWYLALPQGPGFIARICGPGGCVTRTSTDAGPSKAMQRYPFYRVADLSVADFERVCGVPASFGLCPVSVALIGRAR